MKNKTFKSDAVMMILWRALFRDLVPLCESTNIAEYSSLINHDGIPKVREWCSSPTSFSMSPYSYKCIRQLKDFGKRYIFAQDKLTDEERKVASWENFSQTQVRVSLPIRTDLLYGSGLVAIWRRSIKSILGRYDESEHLRFCKFAKNAVVGHPSRRRRLDQKVKGPITGSSVQLSLFRKVLEEDPLLAEATKTSVLREVDSLRLTFVPKSFKSLRAVMPDTLAGSFLSGGLGVYIQQRIKTVGLDIRHLQARHRGLAAKASRPGAGTGNRLATLDLSSASDSLTPQLLRLLLPSDWYRAIERCRLRYYVFDGTRYRLSSACTMGLGHTFPLQTLIFYALVKGIQERYFPKWSQFCSVYGDDIICPSIVVPYVERIFGICHLKLNMDKSFWGLCDFRESCGGDFLRGIAVRPAAPEGVHADLSRAETAQFVYRTLNSLLQRWEPCEIETTLNVGRAILTTLDGFYVSVPHHFPDESGLKDAGPLRKSIKACVARVECWGNDIPMSAVSSETIFLWDWLRSAEVRLRPTSASLLRVRKRRRGNKVTFVAFAVDPSRESLRSSNLTQIVIPGG